MAEKTETSEMPKSLEIFILGAIAGAAGAAILAGPGGMLLFVGLTIMAIGAVASFQEPR